MDIDKEELKKPPCQNLFYSVEVRENGKINLCSLAFMNYEDCYIGNLFEENFEDFWNGEKVRNLRRMAFDGQYPHCKSDKCSMLVGLMFKPDIDVSGGFSEYIKSYPTHVVFTHDSQCNVNCVFCGNIQKSYPAEKVKEMDSRIETHFLPLCRDAKIVKLQGAGEVFASKHSRNLTKAIAQKYPNIKFHIQSNGIFFDKRNCDDLGITDRLHKAVICAHATKEKTYGKLVKGGNFKPVLKNIEWLGSLKKEGKLKFFYMGFIVTAFNYKEMKDYIMIARKAGAEVYFVQLRIENQWLEKNERRVAITNESHPKYNDLVRRLQDPIFTSPDVHLDAVFKTLKPITGKKRFYCFLIYCRKEFKAFINVIFASRKEIR